MAQNKSNKSTPSSRSGYFPELTASAGKQTSFLLPVRIKMTPNTTAGPLSDGKKNPAKMMQPVLIKDLLASTNKKERSNTITSASTQKKKKPQRSTQPFLNTQSCYKPKKEEGETSFLYRKSCGESKVRRQLYQTLDSPHKSATENKENKPKKKMTRNTEEITAKNTAAQSKSRKSLLLPPNSIKNTFMRKSVGTSLKPPAKVLVKNNKVTLSKSTKGNSRITEAGRLQKNVMKSSSVETDDELNTDADFSSPEIDENDKKKSCIMQDNFTMTSPSINRQVHLNKSLHSTSKLDGLITDPLCSEMKNLDISKTPCKCTEKSQLANETEFDFAKMCNLDYSGFIQMKTFLEQSIQACENQASKLKQLLNFVNNIFINSVAVTANSSSNAPTASVITATMNNPLVGTLEVEKKCNISSTIDGSPHISNTTNAINKTLENVNTSDETSNLAKELDKIKVEDETKKVCAEDKLPIPIKILVTEADLHQELKESSSEMLTELARLSTIGEVSCEVDLSNKDENDDTENKENINVLENSSMMVLTPTTPKTPKILRRRRSSSTDNKGRDSEPRRRSARLAAKRASSASLDTSDKQDSFTTLENELNVVVNEKLSSKSLPASPMKPPSTPGIVKQFDKSIHRPLKEYMALKMNGTFLVTPDVKRFNSCFESTDTPHSRKSLSRKIFMELCDLYAESPEHE